MTIDEKEASEFGATWTYAVSPGSGIFPRENQGQRGAYEGHLAGQSHGYKAARKDLLERAQDWCGIHAYDSDKGACDEHTCDDSRGRNCSADELLSFIESIVKDQSK